jgi:hypothetical protein
MRLGELLLAVVVSTTVTVGVATVDSASGAERCGRGAAKKLVRTLPVAKDAEPYLSAISVRCMDFTRDGRKDIVFTVWTAMNHGAHYWAAFRKTTHGHWKRVAFKSDCCGGHHRYGGLGIAIQRAGSVIVVSQPIYKKNDGACCPSGGTKSRAWAWRHGKLRIVK